MKVKCPCCGNKFEAVRYDPTKDRDYSRRLELEATGTRGDWNSRRLELEATGTRGDWNSRRLELEATELRKTGMSPLAATMKAQEILNERTGVQKDN